MCTEYEIYKLLMTSCYLTLLSFLAWTKMNDIPNWKYLILKLLQRNTKMNTSSFTQLKNIPVAIKCILQTRIIYKYVMMEGNVKDGLRSMIWITNMMKYWIIIVVLLSVDQLSECACVCTVLEIHSARAANNLAWMRNDWGSFTL